MIAKTIEDRARYLLTKLPLDWLPEVFYIGGNSLNMVMGDIDLFPVQSDMKFDWSKIPEDSILAETANVLTFKYNDGIIQLCNYSALTLEELIQKFDYAHIQVGACIRDRAVDSIYYTKAFVDSRVLGTSWYTGSDYPMASLVRVIKYRKRGDLNKRHTIESVLNALINIVSRGFKDYNDFKDQLDAVDLGLLSEDYPDRVDLMRLFELLKRGTG